MEEESGGRVLLNMNGCESEDVFSASQEMVLTVVPTIGATFSLLGSIFIIFTYFYVPRLQRIPYKMIMFMSCADAVSAISYLLGLAVNGDEGISCNRTPICYAQAAISQYFEVASMFWVLCVAVHIYLVMYVYRADADNKKIESLVSMYHLVAWGMPSILLLIAISANVFGDAGQWCWISPDYQWARISLYYAWLIIILVLNCAMFYIIVKHDPLHLSSIGSKANNVADASSSTSLKRRNPLAFRLRLYLLAFVATKLFSVINRVQNMADEKNPIFVLYLLQAIFEPFTGFVNAAVYGANKMVVKEYRKKIEANKWLAGIFLALGMRSHTTSRGSIYPKRVNKNYKTRTSIPRESVVSSACRNVEGGPPGVFRNAISIDRRTSMDHTDVELSVTEQQTVASALPPVAATTKAIDGGASGVSRSGSTESGGGCVV